MHMVHIYTLMALTACLEYLETLQHTWITHAHLQCFLNSINGYAFQVDAWMAASPALEPRRLLPALLRCAEEGSAPACRAHALRYVRFCIQGQQSEDPSIHQLAVGFRSFLPALKVLL